MIDIQQETFRKVHVASQLSSKQKDEVQQILEEFSEIFSDIPGCVKDTQHAISLNINIPIKVKPYPIPFTKIEAAEKEVSKMLEMDIIELSNFPYSAPLLLIKKSDGSFRPCIDFRQLNKATKFDSEPIPNREDIYVKLNSKKYFTKIDCCKGYWQILMSYEDREKTAFSTSKGLFYFKRMPFGLVNAGATYCRMMRKLLSNIDCVDCYVDDIPVHTSTWEEHLSILRQLFGRIKLSGLTVKLTKCYVGKQNFLSSQQDKVVQVLNAPIPKTKTKIRAFVWLVRYYSLFTPNYASIAAPLTYVTKKGLPIQIVWNEKANQAYESLKTMLCEHPVLMLPNFDKTFILRIDASGVGLGAMLMQEYNDDSHVIAYASKQFS